MGERELRPHGYPAKYRPLNSLQFHWQFLFSLTKNAFIIISALVINLLLRNIYANSPGLPRILLNTDQTSWSPVRVTKSPRDNGNAKQVRKTDFYHLKQRLCRDQNCSILIKKKSPTIIRSKLQRNTGPKDWLSQITVFVIVELKWCLKRHNGWGMFAIEFLHFCFPLCTRLFWWSTCCCVQMNWTNCLDKTKTNLVRKLISNVKVTLTLSNLWFSRMSMHVTLLSVLKSTATHLQCIHLSLVIFLAFLTNVKERERK